MTIPERKCCYSIPKNEQGDKELEQGVENEENTVYITLSEAEDDSLFHVYNDLNKALNIIIDTYEEEYIYAKDAPKALKVVQKHIDAPESELQAAALEKLKNALEAAIEYGTFLELAL